ncbi:MAG TPA: hypothetical protein VGC91_15875 [Pyrinomonadaceae bacterium]|jgi:hypothetical protein
MNLSARRKAIALLAGLILMTLTTNRVLTAPQPPPLPNPVLILVGVEPYQTGGKHWMRYKYEVMNRTDYPNDMFAASPLLPPCGKNTKSSRTWVDLYDQSGKRLYGFCALSNHDGLNQLWFALEEDVIPPSWIYMEMNDRKTNTKYKSNLAETTL